MIFKGAKRGIKDKDGKKAYDLIEENQFINSEEFKKDLRSILGKQPCHNPICPVNTPIEKLESSNKHYYGYMFLMYTTYGLMYIFIFPYEQFYHWVKWFNIL